MESWMDLGTLSGASFSGCREYRYTLWRRFVENAHPSRMVAFIGLNPSTADETENDPTITRCIKFAKSWGYDGVYMLNAFAFRATDPAVMKKCHEPVGCSNDRVLYDVTRATAKNICCWGNHGLHLNRCFYARIFIYENNRFCLGLTKFNQPKHPLYLRSDTELIEY